MSTPKHTPGPWVCRPCERFPSLVEIVLSNGRDVRTEFASSDEEEMANARLIAAAPEMLDALHVVVGNLKAHGNATPLLFGALVKAEAAISKAEGK